MSAFNLGSRLALIVSSSKVASIADIAYLFDEGMLVDFEVAEIVKLVEALFADSPLRESTISHFVHA